MNERPLRILQICSAREAVYGAVQSLLTLARHQREEGHHVEFLTFSGRKFGSQVRGEGFTANEVKVRAKIDPKAVAQIARVIKAGKFDLVHTHLSTSSVNGGLAAKVAKTPAVATVHGMSGKLSFFAATHLVAVSEGVKQHLIMQGVSANKISVVYNGIESTFCGLAREESRALLGIPLGVPVVGTVSRITALKGIEDAIRAVAQLRSDFPNLQYLLVGDGNGVESCQQLAAELGIADAVRFVGYQANVADYLAAMDVFLFPTLKEAMGISLIEAMAVGLPSVATSTGGIPEVLPTECGFLVPPKDPNAIAASARSLLCQDDLRASMGRAAKDRVEERFSASAMYRHTDAVYRKLLHQK